MVLRCRGPQPGEPGEPAVQRPAELPRRRQPDGQRGGAGAGHPAGAADPARRPVGDVPRRRAARAGPHGLRVVLAVPPPPGGAPAGRRDRRGLRGLRARHGVARQRAPQLRRAVPRAGHRRPGAAPRAGPPTGARRRRARGCSPRGRSSSARRCCCSPRSGWPSAASSTSPTAVLHVRRMLPGLGVGAAVCLALVAVPLWWQFAGPQSYGDIWHPPGGNDLAQLWGRATRSIGADPWASAALSMNRTEENSFFGIPLLLAAAAVVAVLWRRVLVQALAAVVARLVLALARRGGRRQRHVDRHPGALGACSRRCRCSGTCCPPGSRSIAVPALGALLALGIEEVRRVAARYAGSAGAGLAVGAAWRRCSCCCPSSPPRSSSTSGPRCRPSSATARGATGSTRAARCSPRRPRGSPTPGPWSGRPRPGGASRSSPATSSARTPRRRAAASTARRRRR